MLKLLTNFYEAISILDLTYVIITILSLIKCYKNGFVLSVLSMGKWLVTYVVTLIIFPKIKPYFKDIIDNEYVLDIALGITIFVIIVFIILMISKGISKAIHYRYFVWILFWLFESLYYFCMYLFRCPYCV